MILGKNIRRVFSNGRGIKKVYSYSKLIWTVSDPIDPDKYLTIDALEDGLTASLSVNACEYCVDGDGNWIALPADATTPSINKGQKLSFRGNITPIAGSGIGTFSISKKCNLKGNCMAMLFGDDAVNNTILSGKSYAFYNLFRDCVNIVNVSSNFLPATTLADNCYSYMFRGCTSLTAAPVLPATTLADNCYQDMFANCTSLTAAPVLPATTLVIRCYSGMFMGCTSLITAPALPATTLAEKCYYFMFNGCTSLTSAPALPATTLAKDCYNNMFYNCASLTSAPALPATTLASYCYNYMFYGTGLTTAPKLPATTLADHCYRYMFKNCSNLNYIEMLATDISASNCLYDWVDGVAETGTFVKNPSMTSLPTGKSGIPVGWVVEGDDIDYNTSPFTVCAVEDGVTVQLFGRYVRSGNVSKRSTINYKYSINGATWIQTTSDNSVYLNQNDTMRIIGEDGYYCDIKGLSDIYGNIMSLRYGDEFNSKKSWYGDISSDGEVHSFGFFRLSNIRNAENLILPAVELGSCAYASMFAGSETLITAPKILTATELGENCYDYMFNGCKNLKSAPKILPATELKSQCYRSMFEGCTSLTTAPDISATITAMSCCYRMFYGCKKLTSAPKILPALEAVNRCYEYMFTGCTSLTTAPALPATTVMPYCYQGMFSGCTSLTTAPALPATKLGIGIYCYQNMFKGCTSLTTAPALPATSLAEGCYQNMFASCRKITKAPDLKAKTLVTKCYSEMFYNCTSLNYVKCYATSPSDNSTDFVNCVAGMLSNDISTAGTLLCKSVLSNYFRIYVKPTNWTIEEF